jgi:hypothetical protein
VRSNNAAEAESRDGAGTPCERCNPSGADHSPFPTGFNGDLLPAQTLTRSRPKKRTRHLELLAGAAELPATGCRPWTLWLASGLIRNA